MSDYISYSKCFFGVAVLFAKAATGSAICIMCVCVCDSTVCVALCATLIHHVCKQGRQKIN